MNYPTVIEYFYNGDKFRAEYTFDEFYDVYVWSENESVGPFLKDQEIELGWWVMYYHNDYEGIMEIINKEKTKMKPFNLADALAGKPVMTREGRKVVRIFYAEEACENSQVICVFETGAVFPYYKDGTYTNSSSAHELVMAPTKKEGWINIYNLLSLDVTGKSIYPTEEAALTHKGCDCIATIKIEWEE